MWYYDSMVISVCQAVAATHGVRHGLSPPMIWSVATAWTASGLLLAVTLQLQHICLKAKLSHYQFSSQFGSLALAFASDHSLINWSGAVSKSLSGWKRVALTVLSSSEKHVCVEASYVICCTTCCIVKLKQTAKALPVYAHPTNEFY